MEKFLRYADLQRLGIVANEDARVRDLEEEIDRENLAGQFADNREHSKPVISDGSPF